MYAIEFEANIKDGTVNIPSKFSKLYTCSKAKVIIMIEDEAEDRAIRKQDFIEMLTDQPRHLDETTVFLTREQANAR